MRFISRGQVGDKAFTQRRKERKDAKASQIILCVFAFFAPLRETLSQKFTQLGTCRQRGSRAEGAALHGGDGVAEFQARF